VEKCKISFTVLAFAPHHSPGEV